MIGYQDFTSLQDLRYAYPDAKDVICIETLAPGVYRVWYK